MAIDVASAPANLDEATALSARLESDERRTSLLTIGGVTVRAEFIGDGAERLITHGEVLNTQGVTVGLVQIGCLLPMGWMWAAGAGWEEQNEPTVEEAVAQVVKVAKRSRVWSTASWDEVYRAHRRYSARKKAARR